MRSPKTGAVTKMDEETIKVQAPCVVTTQPEGKFTLNQQEGAFFVHHATDHNEISIMKSDWDEICRKAKAIKLKKRFDWIALLWGAAIPYVIEAGMKISNHESVDYFPLAFCFFFIAVCKSLKDLPFRNPFKYKVKLLKKEPEDEPLYAENESDNYVHHDDLLKMLDRITKNITPR